jgi:hypothetical protein
VRVRVGADSEASSARSANFGDDPRTVRAWESDALFTGRSSLFFEGQKKAPDAPGPEEGHLGTAEMSHMARRRTT